MIRYSDMTRTPYLVLALLCTVARPAWSQDRHLEVQLPTPSPVQLAWQQAELGVLVCYELHTFNEGRYIQSQARVEPIESIDQFNPTQLDTDQWIRTVKEMGARFAILTASHESGFRLWQSDVNPYSLRSTKWGDGKRDIVREFIDSCHKYGIKPGIYLGTRWNSHLGVYDFKVTDRSTITQQQYNDMIEQEVKEICSGYGDLFELWFDGGAYGPENGGPDVLSVFEAYQKNCLFYHNYDRADARWGGSESGTVAYPCWATFPYKATGSGESTINRHVGENGFSLLKHGDPEGPYWMPAMSDAPLRNHEWFWEPGDDHRIYPLDSLLNMYYKSVGRNSTLIVGLTPDTRGLIPDADVNRCRELGDSIRDIFQHPIVETSGVGSLVSLDLPGDSWFDHIVIQEDIRKGERVRQFKLECFSDGQWTELDTGTCIGHKCIVKIKPVTGDKLRLSIGESIAEPVIKMLAVYNSIQSGPADVAIKTSDWHGYQKQSFTLAEHPAFVVVPKVAAPGNPWIWRTSFPDFHAEVDRELVDNGFHIGFVNVVTMLGSDASLDIMDQFYGQVRAQWGLAARPALEPCSRGGLHAYRYAARHPERVACILGDVPVMDLKSWPLGWPDATQQVTDAMKFYGFESKAELKAFTGNPVDLLAPVAKARIPIRHAICLNDKVVPPEQNTLEAQRRLRVLGHDMELVVIAESKIAHGHHFTMPKVFESARFVMQHACVMPGNIEYFELRNGLANALAAFETRKTGRVAFLGGSITYNGGWRDELMRYVKKRFPETQFDFIAAGIPSIGSNGHAFRLQRDVLMRGPVDLLFVEAAVNDGSNIPDKPEIMRRAMEGIVRQIRTVNPMTDVVHMHFAMGPHLDAYKVGKVPGPIVEHEKAAVHYGCTTLNITREVADRIKAGEFTWKSGFNSNVHPPAYGQRVYANSMTRMLDAAFATTAKPKPHALPDTLVDPHSYVTGRFGPLQDAALGQGFTLDPKWRPARGGTRGGFVDVPALVASEPGSEFSYEFEGTAFGLFLAAGYDTCVLEFSIDGGENQKIDTLTPWSRGLHLPWPLMLAHGLSPGKHNITIQTTGDVEARTALHIIHFLLN